MKEEWKPVARFEALYEVSNLGRVRSKPAMQRYLLRNGKEAFRRVLGKVRAPKRNNSGYLLVSLFAENVEYTALVHRLVAAAFIEGSGETVNHIDGDKDNNAAINLEWASWSANHLHAVRLGLNKQAVRVVSPATGLIYDSIAQAAKAEHHNHRSIRATWARA
jgi:hypothetical protein